MRTSPAGTSTEAGFTLIEVAVVVMIVGLLLAMVAPRLPSLTARRLETSGGRIAALVRHLYNEAALTGLEHRLRIDLTQGSLSGLRLEADGELVPIAGSGREQLLPSPVRLLDVLTADGNKHGSGRLDARILPIGWVDETILHLADDEGRMLTLHLQPLTGLTDIQDGYREVFR